jgi:hypothetical protein
MGVDTRYIVVRRLDIPNGTLQVLDLKPNESQRTVYDPPGQTKYLNRFQNEAVTTYVGAGGSIRAAREVKGVAAYLIDHVEAGGLAAGLAAFTAAQAVAAAAGLVVRINAGSAMALADVDTALSVVVADTELTNGGASSQVQSTLCQVVPSLTLTAPLSILWNPAHSRLVLSERSSTQVTSCCP